ncbi:esterase LipI-like isoform X1 [Haliotis rufescens]|uniref:esterase LipI-like isoform X1 n=1 Tax=Haliotis rufescens TaxID=6454 RepID=UPI00201F5CC4|nr:esterase LipI-like isoform X1 [Haliotis rufescens]
MGCLKVLAISMSVLMIGLSAYLYTPVPDDMTEPWKLRSILAAFKMVKLISGVSEMVGLGSRVNVTRGLIKMFATQAVASKSDPLLKVTDTRLSGIPVRIYRPKSAPTPSPALVYFHGGGWIFGSVDQYDEFTAEIARAANIVVMSVEYRLAPEHPFPIPFEDCVTATLHLLQNPKQYGVDGNRIAVGGDSAGGNLAAAIAKRFSDEPTSYIQRLKFQLLIYPVLQPFDFNLPSFHKFKDDPMLSKEEVVICWILYLGLKEPEKYYQDFATNNHTSMILKYSDYARSVSQELLPERFQTPPMDILNKNEGNDALSNQIEAIILDATFAPLLAQNLTQVPPAYIMTADTDVLRDEGMIYAERLRRAGIRVNTYHVKQASHGFCYMYLSYSFTQLEVCHRALKEIVNYIEVNMNKE